MLKLRPPISSAASAFHIRGFRTPHATCFVVTTTCLLVWLARVSFRFALLQAFRVFSGA